MPDAPWRCSQCGTVNEPVANACRTCGRWPSLFDLEESKLEEIPPVRPGAPAPTMEAAPAFDTEPAPVEAAPPDVVQPDGVDVAPPQRPQWRRLLRFAVPVAVALYFLVSSALNR